MNKLWVALSGLFILGLFSAYTAAGNNSNVKINDLETECREDREKSTKIELSNDNSLRFNGYFPVESTNSDLDIVYKGGNNIVLNVESEPLKADNFLWSDCLASGVYDLQTNSFEEGRYSVEVKYNGKRAEKRIIRITD